MSEQPDMAFAESIAEVMAMAYASFVYGDVRKGLEAFFSTADLTPEQLGWLAEIASSVALGAAMALGIEVQRGVSE